MVVMKILIHTLVGDVVCALLAAQEDHHPLRTHAFHAFHAFHALRTHADQHHHQACITSHPPSSNISLLHHLLSFPPPITHASQLACSSTPYSTWHCLVAYIAAKKFFLLQVHLSSTSYSSLSPSFSLC